MPDREEAAGLAVAFAVDYLSWDEDDAARRGRVLARYLRDPGADPAHLGWSGCGRQRAELVAPGRVSATGAGRVVVDVRVRVTPYRAVGAPGVPPDPAPGPELGSESDQAVAPAPTGRGWRSLASEWIRLSVPVVLDGGRLMIDNWTAAPAPAPAESGLGSSSETAVGTAGGNGGEPVPDDPPAGSTGGRWV
jgi:hypothetical protein